MRCPVPAPSPRQSAVRITGRREKRGLGLARLAKAFAGPLGCPVEPPSYVCVCVQWQWQWLAERSAPQFWQGSWPSFGGRGGAVPVGLPRHGDLGRAPSLVGVRGRARVCVCARACVCACVRSARACAGSTTSTNGGGGDVGRSGRPSRQGRVRAHPKTSCAAGDGAIAGDVGLGMCAGYARCEGGSVRDGHFFLLWKCCMRRQTSMRGAWPSVADALCGFVRVSCARARALVWVEQR